MERAFAWKEVLRRDGGREMEKTLDVFLKVKVICKNVEKMSIGWRFFKT